MRVSLHTDQALKVLEYVKDLELPTGGIAGWKGAPAYPEISGYIIPTLMDYGEFELAVRLADWLVGIQNDDGSFGDIYGQKRSFDTSAVMEGLKDYQLFSISGNDDYYQAAARADRWLSGMIRGDGSIRTKPGAGTHLYTMRISWLLNSQAGAEYWMKAEWPDTREHYVAYALEGLWNMGYEEFVREKLEIRNNWRSEDLCANAQFVILFYQAGLSDWIPLSHLVNALRGKLSNSWTAKWVLDMWKVIGD